MVLRETALIEWFTTASQPKDQIPPPMTASLVFSAKRDATYVECTFDGWVPRENFKRTAFMRYGKLASGASGSPGWFFGADAANWNQRSGRLTTKVRFQVGPYRLASVTRWLASWYLYEELLLQMSPASATKPMDLLDENAIVIPVTTGGRALYASQSTRAGYWLYVLSGGDAASVQGPASVITPGPERANFLNELHMSLNLKAFMGTLKFDPVVAALYDNFHLMVMVDPLYLSRNRLTLADLEDPAQQATLVPPEFIVRNVLDPPTAWYDTTQLAALPVADDTSFDASASLSIRRNEDTALLFWNDGRTIDPMRIASNITPPLPQGAKLWRHGVVPPSPPLGFQTWDDWTIIGVGADDTGGFNLNPHTLYSPFQLPDLDHANLEGEIQRDKNELRLRERRVTAAAPRNVDELLQFVPGNACRVASITEREPTTLPLAEQAIYWITEMKVNQPAMTMHLDLVLPGDMPTRDLPQMAP